MKLELRYGIPFAKALLINNDKKVLLKNVVIDTGSASTIISTETAIELDLEAQLSDEIHRVRGVGGTEFVYEKVIYCIEIDNVRVEKFEIQVGAMNYGFEIDAILGMNFLQAGEIVIDCDKMELSSSKELLKQN